MSLPSTSFAGSIRAIAVTMGRVVEEQTVARIETVAQSLASLTDAGAVVVDAGSGPIPVASYIAAELARLAPVAQPASGRDAPERVGIRVTGAFNLRTAVDPEREAQIARDVATWPNPWKGQINRTRQAIITKSNPALAAKFKAEAGV